MRVCTLSVFMEQRVVICFLTRKGLRASAIAAELKLLAETEALALSTVKKWCRRFAEGRISLYGDPRCERPLTNNLVEAISSLLKERPHLSCKVLCQHFRIAKRTCFRILHDTLGVKNPISVGFPLSWTQIRRPKESLYHMEFFRNYRAFILLVSRVPSLAMNQGSFCIISVIRYGGHDEMKCQKSRSKN
jgi:transposase